MKILKNKFIILIVLILMIVIFIPTIVDAGVTDGGTVNRITTTNYHTTIKIVGSVKNEKTGNIENFEKISEEIDGNTKDEVVINRIKSLKQEFNNWAFENGAAIVSVEDEEISDYYYEAHDEITASRDGLEGDIHDLDYSDVIQGTITINTILDKHQTYTINATTSNEINISLQAPMAGSSVNPKHVTVDEGVILVGDPNNIFGAYGEPEDVPIATTSDKITIDSTAWVMGTYTEFGEGYDNYFFGTFEKDKYYYAMISISANKDCVLSSNLKIKVNGEAPAEVFAVYNNENTHFIAKIKAKEYQLGDVNKDGKINAQDATLILKYLAKKVELTDEQLVLADTDRDGRVKASDAVRILKYVAKKINEI